MNNVVRSRSIVDFLSIILMADMALGNVCKLSNKTCDIAKDVCLCRTRSFSDAIQQSKSCASPSMTMQHWQLAPRQLLLERFPIDTERRNYVREVRRSIFSAVAPTPFEGTVELVAVSDDALTEILDMSPSIGFTDEFVAVASGNRLLQGSAPLAHRYGGHQFGLWADQLGDGRAHLLGEYVNRRGERWELQLKGSGRTPYSRSGDGRAVVRSSVREFLASEAMFYIGIPTSRAASLVVSSERVLRDQFYNGRRQTEPTAVVLRLARSWFRFGSLEILARSGEIDLLEKLTDFVIEHHFPTISLTDPDRYLSFYNDVVSQTAELVARWQSVGFAHGVCNTDNFSLLSITIDYGPFRFMDEYNPYMVPNTSDDEHRYSYGRQPDAGRYNLEMLREALSPLIQPDQRPHMEAILRGYDSIYDRKRLQLFREKLGLAGAEDSDDGNLVGLLLKIMHSQKADFTMVFRQLADCEIDSMDSQPTGNQLWAMAALQKDKRFPKWVKLYQDRLLRYRVTEKVRREQMHAVNPRYVLRNWIAEEAIRQTEKNDFSVLRKVYEMLKTPYTEQEDAELSGYADPPPSWAARLRVSCSS